MRSAHARRGRTTCLALACALVACAVACKKPDPPIMTVDAVKAVDWAVTGVALDITFKLRNPNPKALRIERFDYDLFLNGQLVGHGYQSAGVDLAGFAEQKVSSRLDVSFLKAPFAIKEIFKQKSALAKAKGNFYVKLGWTTRAVPFDRDMDLTLRQGPDSEPSATPPPATARSPSPQTARPGRPRP